MHGSQSALPAPQALPSGFLDSIYLLHRLCAEIFMALQSSLLTLACRPGRGNALEGKSDVVGSGSAGPGRPPLPAGITADAEDNPKGLAAVAAARRFSRQQGSRPASESGAALAARRTTQQQGEAAAAALAQRRLDRLGSQSKVPEVCSGLALQARSSMTRLLSPAPHRA